MSRVGIARPKGCTFLNGLDVPSYLIFFWPALTSVAQLDPILNPGLAVHSVTFRLSLNFPQTPFTSLSAEGKMKQCSLKVGSLLAVIDHSQNWNEIRYRVKESNWWGLGKCIRWHQDLNWRGWRWGLRLFLSENCFYLIVRLKVVIMGLVQKWQLWGLPPRGSWLKCLGKWSSGGRWFSVSSGLN